MRKVILSIALLLASGVFTSCTDASEDNIQEQEKLEIQNTGGENDHDPDEEDDEVSIKGGKESIDTGGEEDPIDEEEEDPNPPKIQKFESTDTGGETDKDPDPEEDPTSKEALLKAELKALILEEKLT